MEEFEIAFIKKNSRSRYIGMSFDKSFLLNYLEIRVKPKLFDYSGTETLMNEYGDIARTGFQKAKLQEIFKSRHEPIPWRIGEALSECYLEDYCNARFHYESSRDAKNPRSNLTGADIVGFIDINDQTIFLFGEVKTSNQKLSPPTILYGRSGLIKQLEIIVNKKEVRYDLIKWLGFKAKNLENTHGFQIDYRRALEFYLRSDGELVKIVGILVRDIEPNEKDLKSRYNRLLKNLNKNIYFDLKAFYLPIDINQLDRILINGGNTIGN